MKGYIVIIAILATIVSSLITLNVSFQQTLQMEMAEQFNKQQLLLAGAEASNIQTYINSTRDEVIHIAQFVSMYAIRKEQEIDSLTRELFKDADKVKKGLMFVDREGKPFFSKGTVAFKEADAADWVKMARRFCPGQALVQHDAKNVYVVTPLCRSDNLAGALVVSIDIQDIANEFLSPIKSGLRGYAWMMDDKGDLLYHPTQPDMVGKNLYKTDATCFRCHKSFDVEKKIIEGRGDQYGKHVAPSGEDKVLAFSTATVGDAKWIIAVSAPYSEVTKSIQRSMRFYSWLIIAIFVTTSIVSAMLIVLHRKRVKAEEMSKHQKELEQYAEDLEKKVQERTEELSAEKEKLDTIVGAIGSGIILFDIYGIIIWVNQTMRDIAGRDLIGMTWEHLRAGSTVVGSYSVEEGRTEVMVNLLDLKDRYFQVTTAPVRGYDGETHGYIRLVQDVTEMKKMEDQMMHSEKLASIGRLTAGIAHEIGNPLTSVFSFVQILKEMEQDEFKKESLETIYFHIRRIADILKQLSGFSKMQPVELKAWSVNNLIETSLSLIQYDKRAKDITIVRDLAPDVPDITTDGHQLSQVIVNLILNAVDAMPGGGSLTVTSRRQDNTILIDFKDTGVGIPAEHINRIFDPFFTTKEKGTGLGLAVSYNIIKKLNGTLSVESEEYKGTRFRITLPVNGSQ